MSRQIDYKYKFTVSFNYIFRGFEGIEGRTWCWQIYIFIGASATSINVLNIPFCIYLLQEKEMYLRQYTGKKCFDIWDDASEYLFWSFYLAARLHHLSYFYIIFSDTYFLQKI